MRALTEERGSHSLRLGLLGLGDDEAEAAELGDRIDAAAPEQSLQLDVYDAEQLAEPVLAALGRRVAAGAPTRIQAYRPLLVHSLARLDLPVRLVSAPTAQRAQHAPFRALALAGSANSLDKLLHIVERLPDSEAAVFVLQHVAEDQPNRLDALLRARTGYRVLMPQHLTPVQAGTIYVAPPGHHMKVGHGLVYLTRDKPVQFARPSIDELFDTLAREYGAGLLAVLLCGFGGDGVQGCLAARAAGATVLVEQAEECREAGVLPAAAQRAGACDQVLGFRALAQVLATAVRGGEAFDEDSLEPFLLTLCLVHGLDLSGYERAGLLRRLRHLQRQLGVPGRFELECELFGGSEGFARLLAELPVGVTEFFRHPEQWRTLGDTVLPYLSSFSGIKVWSAGCASGEEAYSLAMLLQSQGLLARSRVFGTDLNPHLLDLARAAIYPIKALARAGEQARAGGLRDAFDTLVERRPGFFRIADSIRTTLLFHRHSLVDGEVFNEFQLILCRNVLIYFDAATQLRVLELLRRSLHRDGFLLLGPQDGLPQKARAAGLLPVDGAAHLYRRGDRDG